MNKVILLGRLTADPEYKQTPQGTQVCKFTVAVDRDYKDKQGERQADFFRCTAWNGTADFISRYFVKGKPIVIEGSLRNNDYTDNNGVKHYSTEINVDKAAFSLNDNTQGQQPQQNNYPLQQNGYNQQPPQNNYQYPPQYAPQGYNQSNGYNQQQGYPQQY